MLLYDWPRNPSEAIKTCDVYSSMTPCPGTERHGQVGAPSPASRNEVWLRSWVLRFAVGRVLGCGIGFGEVWGTIKTVGFPQLNAEGEFLRAVPSGPGFFSTSPRPTYQPRIAVARRVPKKDPKP